MKPCYTIAGENVGTMVSVWSGSWQSKEIICIHYADKIEISDSVSQTEKEIILNHDRELKDYE